MGALEYKPALVDKEDASERLTVDALSELADRVLKMREDAKASLVPGISEYASILKVGSSAGGAREGAHRVERGDGRGEVRTGCASPPMLRSAMTSSRQSRVSSASRAVPSHRLCLHPPRIT